MSKPLQYVEIISAVAVVISLIFVGLEIRHSNRLAESEAVAGINNSTNEMNLMVANNLDLSVLLARAYKGETDLTDGERVALAHYATGWFNIWEAAWTSYDRGIIDSSVVQGHLDSACWNFANLPIMVDAWESNKNVFAPGLVEAIEDNC